MMARRHAPFPVACLLVLCACAGAGGWTKAGADQAAVRQEYEDCRALADTAVRTDADIDHDIAASRANDWQRAGIVRVESQVMHEHTRDRAAAIIGNCMRSKGFREGKP
jgi:hypothetical protein